MDSVSKYKVLNCSHGVCGTVAKRHEKLGIDSSEWHRRIEQLGVKGKLNPAAIKAIEYELMSDTARAKLQMKNRYESMSKIDRWLHDVTQYTISQAIAEIQRPEDVAAVDEDMKKRMHKFGRTVKFDLGLNF